MPTRACHLCSLALPLLHPSLGSDTGVCSSDGIADPVADQYRRHERANISTDDVSADIAIADIPRDTIAHVRRCSLPTAVQRMHARTDLVRLRRRDLCVGRAAQQRMPRQLLSHCRRGRLSKRGGGRWQGL